MNPLAAFRRFFTREGLLRAFQIAMRYVPLLVVMGTFFVSRYYYRIKLGARFDASTLTYFCQFVDPELLKTDLLRTCFYLNHQAPVMNFVAGLALKISEENNQPILDFLFFTGGFIVVLGIFFILKRLGVRPWLAAVAASIYTATPPVMFYELWLIYHHFVTMFLVLSALALLYFIRKETVSSGILFFSMLAMVVLTRATFGLVFMGASAVILLFYRPVPRKTVLKAAALPMLLIGLYTIKTPIQTHHSLGHALLAPNLVQKVLNQIPETEREELYKAKAIAPMEREEPLPNLAKHPQFKVNGVPKTGVEVLDKLQRPNGNINPNALQYVYIADIAMHDAKFLIRKYPKAYLRSLGLAAFYMYFRSPTDDICAPRSPAYKAIIRPDTGFSKILLLGLHNASLVLQIALPLTLLFAIGKLLSARARLASQRATTSTIAFLLVTIVYAASTLLISYGDFSRYRFEVDVFYTMLFTLLVEDVLAFFGRGIRAIRRRRSKGRAVSEKASKEAAGALPLGGLAHANYARADLTE